MSSVSSVGGVSQSMFQYLQALNSSQQASQIASASSATAAQGSDGDSSGAAPRVSGGHHHHRGGGGGKLFSQIQSAVSSALQTAQSSGSSSDPNQVIENAIAQVLKNHQNLVNGSTGATPGASGNDPDGDGDTDAPGVADSDTSNSASTFAQLLQSNGVNAQQFQQDFLAAIQSAQNGGSTDASSVFSGFPPGSAIDVLA